MDLYIWFIIEIDINIIIFIVSMVLDSSLSNFYSFTIFFKFFYKNRYYILVPGLVAISYKSGTFKK